MNNYVYISIIGNWTQLNERKIPKNLKNFYKREINEKINDPTSFCLFHTIKEKGNPEKVYLLVTNQTKQAGHIIKNKWSWIDVELKEIDAFDIQKTRKIINNILEEEKYVVFNLNGGTKPIIISCLLELFVRFLYENKIEIFYVQSKNQKGEMSKFEEMYLINLNEKLQDHLSKYILMQGIHFLKNNEYNQAINRLREIKITGKEKTQAIFFEKLSLFLRQIENLEFLNSKDILNQAIEKLSEIEKSNDIKKIENFLIKRKEILDKKNDDLKICYILDLLFLSERNLNKDNHNLASVLLYRSFEFFLAYILEKKYNFSKNNFNGFSKQKIDEINKKYNEILKFFSGKKIEPKDITKLDNLYMKELMAIFIVLNKDFEKFFEENKNIINELINYRNKNKLIHWYFEEYNIKKDKIWTFLQNYKNFLKKNLERYSEFEEICNFNFSFL